MIIVTSLLHANYKENLMTRFSANKQNRLKHLFIFDHVAMATAHVGLIINNLKFVLTCLLPFLTTKGSRVLEKKVHETEVSKTV